MMNIFKSTKASPKKQSVSSRRSFMWKMGAGASTALASASGLASTGSGQERDLKKNVDSLSMQVASLEAESQLRKLHQTYEGLLDRGMYNDVPEMFADDAEVIFNGGLFKGASQGIKRLYTEHFTAGKSGTKIEPAPGFELTTDQQQDAIELAPDHLSAKAVFTYSIQVGKPIDSDSPLIKMARLQGEGIQQWWEGGVYDISYVRDVTEGSWKIKTLEYKTLSRADYRPGRSYAKPIASSQFSKLYPLEPSGPDQLV